MFIGTREVDKVEGNIVMFKDGDMERHTEVSLKYLLSEEAVDDSDLQQIAIEKVAQDFLNIMEIHNTRFSDVQRIFQQVTLSCNQFNEKMSIKASGLAGKYEGNTEKQIRNIRVLDVKDFLNS